MQHWQNNSVQSNGIRIQYYRTGGNKPVLLLAHGFTDNGLCWSRTARELESQYDIIMLDARGHGLSAKPKLNYSSDDHAADAAGVIKALTLDPVLILGHSMGAMTAISLGAGYPELVRGILLEDPLWREESDPLYLKTAAQVAVLTDNWRGQIENQKRLAAKQIEAAGRERCPRWHADEFPAWVQSKLQVSADVVSFVTTGNQHWLALIKKIHCPILLITGNTAEQAIVSPAVVKRAMASNSQLQHVHIAGAGHNIHREDFSNFLVAVRQFLSQTID